MDLPSFFGLIAKATWRTVRAWIWMLGLCAGVGMAMLPARAQEIVTHTFAPPDGRGPIVVMLSTNAGVDAHRPFAASLASAGYYVVLADGRDFLVGLGAGDLRGLQGPTHLKAIIASSQNAPGAQAGKVAVVGFALGGAAALKHAAHLADDVACVVAYYPVLSVLGSAVIEIAAGFRVPVQLIAGQQDSRCCNAVPVQTLLSAPKTSPFDAVLYPGAGHAFDLRGTGFVHAEQDAADAAAKTIAFLKKWHSASKP